MNSIFEFLLCPQHGLLRPDNLAAMMAVWQQGWLVVLQTIQKFRRII